MMYRFGRPSPNRSRRGAVAGALGVFLGLAVALAAAAIWWTRSEGEGGSKLDPSRIVTVELRDVIDGVQATGRVEPLARVAVMSRASGIIEKLTVDEGDRVETGQVLAELDREQLQAQFDQDQADLLAAEARLLAARARVEEASVRAADPEPEFLRRDAERLEELYTKGDVSIRERDDAARTLAVADFRVSLVRANLPVLEAAVTEAEALLAAARAQLDRTATGLREATIRCPIDGIVLVRDKEVGDGISSILTAGGNATQLMTLGDLREMYIEARVDEVDLGRIREDMPAIVTVDAYRGVTLKGRVRRIAPAGSIDDNGIVTFEVEVAVEDPERLLRPDMTADAKLVLERRDGVTSLPQVAVREADDGWAVDRVVGTDANERVESVPVELGLSDGLMTEIVSGLSVGDRVLVPIASRGR